jgi:hypothetical protein
VSVTSNCNPNYLCLVLPLLTFRVGFQYSDFTESNSPDSEFPDLGFPDSSFPDTGFPVSVLTESEYAVFPLLPHQRSFFFCNMTRVLRCSHLQIFFTAAGNSLHLFNCCWNSHAHVLRFRQKLKNTIFLSKV